MLLPEDLPSPQNSMGQAELLFLSILRATIEISMFCLIGQGLLALLVGSRRGSNTIYRLFVIVTDPVLKVARMVMPPQVIDRHLPFVAFFLLFWLWIGLAYLKKLYCDGNQLQCI
jgi:uncharacterized protein YggT (Ycf19 family)